MTIGEPNNAGGEDCTQMSDTGLWDDVSCSLALNAFACDAIATPVNESINDNIPRLENITLIASINNLNVYLCDDSDITTSCVNETFINVTNVICIGSGVCNNITVLDSDLIACRSERTCENSTIYGSKKVWAKVNSGNVLSNSLIVSKGIGNWNSDKENDFEFVTKWINTDKDVKVKCIGNDNCFLNLKTAVDDWNKDLDIDCEKNSTCYINTPIFSNALELPLNKNCFVWYYNLIPSLMILIVQFWGIMYCSILFRFDKATKQLLKLVCLHTTFIITVYTLV